MFHGNDHPPRSGYQVHRTAHAFDHFARNHPIRNTAGLVHFHRAQHAEVNVAAANHGKGIGAGKICCAREFADRFFAGINKVRIFRPFQGIGADSQHAVLRLQNHIHPRRNTIGNQGWQPDAEVDIKSVAQFAGNPFHNAVAFVEAFGGFG